MSDFILLLVSMVVGIVLLVFIVAIGIPIASLSSCGLATQTLTFQSRHRKGTLIRCSRSHLPGARLMTDILILRNLANWRKDPVSRRLLWVQYIQGVHRYLLMEYVVESGRRP